MQIPKDGCLLRIFLGERDRWHGRPLHEVIVWKAREMHLAGATVLRGAAGFGAKSRMHTAKVLCLSEDLPLVIEIVDAQDKIEAFLPLLDPMLQGCLVTLEPVRVLRYQAGTPPTATETGQ